MKNYHPTWVGPIDRSGPTLKKCVGCGVNYADPPSKLCPGCQAYKDHTGAT